jgi:cytochrome b561
VRRQVSRKVSKQVSRYHPLLVALHWLIAAMIVGLLCIGFFRLAQMSNTDPHKVAVLRLHMAGGMSVLALMLVRAAVRLFTARPRDARTGYAFADRLASLSHYASYVLVVLMVATGYATALKAGLPEIVFGNSGGPLPPRFDVYPTFTAHWIVALLLVGLVALHTFAALYHQFVRKDGLFQRMSFGRRKPAPAPAE